jgi:hypothetical protein
LAKQRNQSTALFSIQNLLQVEAKTENQQRAFDYFLEGYNLILSGNAGTGKLQPLTEPVLTPKGWSTMGKLSVGDEVVSQDGKSTKVLQIFEGKDLNIYRVEFTDGTWTECCEDHLWKVATPKLQTKDRYVVMSLKAMLPKIQNKVGVRNGHYYSIPVNAPVEFEPRDVSLNPYLLGWLLGDGYLPEDNVVCISTWNVDTEEISSLLSPLVPEDCRTTIYDESPSSPNVRRIAFDFNIKKYLIELGLLGAKSLDKFVPKDYLYNTVEVRKAVLAGLLDTDGTVDIIEDRKKKARFHTSSKQLLEDVAELIRSLGGVVTTGEQVREGRPNVEYHLNFRLPFNPFVLSRKAEEYGRFDWKFKFIKKIKSATYIGKKDGRCLLVDNPEHLYLTRDYIVTHNTFLALNLALKSLLLKKYDKIVLFRSTVPTRNQGFLKGSLEEKEAPYEDVYRSIFSELLPTIPNSYDVLKKEKTLEFKSTSFVRGLTLKNSIVIVDEFQNLSAHELGSVITRLGEGSKIVFSGDYLQSDFRYEDEKSGVLTFLKILANMPDDFKRIDFQIEDVVRSGLVKRYLLSEHTLRQQGQL